MIFITPNRKLLKEAVGIYKNQTKSHSALAKIYKYILYVLLNVMFLETVSFIY